MSDLMAIADDDGIDYGQIIAMYEEWILINEKSKTVSNGWLLVGLYLLAIVLANLSVYSFGPSFSVINAFLFIGLDLTARDELHAKWKYNKLWLKMGGLIMGGSILSYALNYNTANIAIASFLAFATAGVIDAIVYNLLDSRARYIKINGSNVISAIADSVIFSVVAFGYPVLWFIVLGQILAKVTGGLLWSFIIPTTKGV